MPDKNEIERRKQIARELKQKAREQFEKTLPTSRENLKSLFSFVDENLIEDKFDDDAIL